mgnify:CR=1 FL=1
MEILKCENVRKVYGSGNNQVVALDHIDLSVQKGEFVAIVGASGSGKSTLLHILGSVDKPTEGKVLIEGTELSAMNRTQAAIFRRRKVGLVYQFYNLIPTLTVRKNILMPLLLDKRKPNKEYFEQIVHSLGIEDKLEALPSQLSGGQQQRVAIARALVKLPRVLLLDEPLSNLDARLRLQTREEIRRIQQETQITTIFVTHDQDEAMSISDMIVVMKDGIVQQIGKPQNVYDDPVNLFVAKFLGTPPINVFSGEVKNEQLYIGSEAVLSTPGVSDQPVHVGIRPEGFILKEDGPLSCDLVRLEVMGRDVSIVSTHEQSQNVTIRSIIDADEGKSLPTGKVHFGLKPAKVFLFCTDTEERIRF